MTTAGSAPHTSLFPALGRDLARTGARSHTHFREGRTEIPACPAAGARQGRLAALSRRATRGGLRGGGGFPEATADCVPCRRLPPSLLLAHVSREGPSVPVAGAWPRTSGPPFADWGSAPVTPLQATPPAPGQGLGKRRVTSLCRGGFWVLPRLGLGSGVRRLREREDRVPYRHAPARLPWFSSCRSGRRKCKGTFPPAASFLNHDFCKYVARALAEGRRADLSDLLPKVM